MTYDEPEAESLTEWMRRTNTRRVMYRPAKNSDEWGPGTRHWTVTLRHDSGRTLAVPFSQGSAHKDPPTARDVLSCLVMDIPEDGATFEEWAADYGFDPDSRRAERIFRAVERQTLALREWAGPDFESLRLVDTDR